MFATAPIGAESILVPGYTVIRPPSPSGYISAASNTIIANQRPPDLIIHSNTTGLSANDEAVLLPLKGYDCHDLDATPPRTPWDKSSRTAWAPSVRPRPLVPVSPLTMNFTFGSGALVFDSSILTMPYCRGFSSGCPLQLCYRRHSSTWAHVPLMNSKMGHITLIPPPVESIAVSQLPVRVSQYVKIRIAGSNIDPSDQIFLAVSCNSNSKVAVPVSSISMHSGQYTIILLVVQRAIRPKACFHRGPVITEIPNNSTIYEVYRSYRYRLLDNSYNYSMYEPLNVQFYLGNQFVENIQYVFMIPSTNECLYEKLPHHARLNKLKDHYSIRLQEAGSFSFCIHQIRSGGTYLFKLGSTRNFTPQGPLQVLHSVPSSYSLSSHRLQVYQNFTIKFKDHPQLRLTNTFDIINGTLLDCGKKTNVLFSYKGPLTRINSSLTATFMIDKPIHMATVCYYKSYNRSVAVSYELLGTPDRNFNVYRIQPSKFSLNQGYLIAHKPFTIYFTDTSSLNLLSSFDRMALVISKRNTPNYKDCESNFYLLSGVKKLNRSVSYATIVINTTAKYTVCYQFYNRSYAYMNQSLLVVSPKPSPQGMYILPATENSTAVRYVYARELITLIFVTKSRLDLALDINDMERDIIAFSLTSNCTQLLHRSVVHVFLGAFQYKHNTTRVEQAFRLMLDEFPRPDANSSVVQLFVCLRRGGATGNTPFSTLSPVTELNSFRPFSFGLHPGLLVGVKFNVARPRALTPNIRPRPVYQRGGPTVRLFFVPCSGGGCYGGGVGRVGGAAVSFGTPGRWCVCYQARGRGVASLRAALAVAPEAPGPYAIVGGPSGAIRAGVEFALRVRSAVSARVFIEPAARSRHCAPSAAVSHVGPRVAYARRRIAAPGTYAVCGVAYDQGGLYHRLSRGATFAVLPSSPTNYTLSVAGPIEQEEVELSFAGPNLTAADRVKFLQFGTARPACTDSAKNVERGTNASSPIEYKSPRRTVAKAKLMEGSYIVCYNNNEEGWREVMDSSLLRILPPNPMHYTIHTPQGTSDIIASEYAIIRVRFQARGVINQVKFIDGSKSVHCTRAQPIAGIYTWAITPTTIGLCTSVSSHILKLCHKLPGGHTWAPVPRVGAHSGIFRTVANPFIIQFISQQRAPMQPVQIGLHSARIPIYALRFYRGPIGDCQFNTTDTYDSHVISSKSITNFKFEVVFKTHGRYTAFVQANKKWDFTMHSLIKVNGPAITISHAIPSTFTPSIMVANTIINVTFTRSNLEQSASFSLEDQLVWIRDNGDILKEGTPCKSIVPTLSIHSKLILAYDNRSIFSVRSDSTPYGHYYACYKRAGPDHEYSLVYPQKLQIATPIPNRIGICPFKRVIDAGQILLLEFTALTRLNTGHMDTDKDKVRLVPSSHTCNNPLNSYIKAEPISGLMRQNRWKARLPNRISSRNVQYLICYKWHLDPLYRELGRQTVAYSSPYSLKVSPAIVKVNQMPIRIDLTGYNLTTEDKVYLVETLNSHTCEEYCTKAATPVVIPHKYRLHYRDQTYVSIQLMTGIRYPAHLKVCYRKLNSLMIIVPGTIIIQPGSVTSWKANSSIYENTWASITFKAIVPLSPQDTAYLSLGINCQKKQAVFGSFEAQPTLKELTFKFLFPANTGRKQYRYMCYTRTGFQTMGVKPLVNIRPLALALSFSSLIEKQMVSIYLLNWTKNSVFSIHDKATIVCYHCACHGPAISTLFNTSISSLDPAKGPLIYTVLRHGQYKYCYKLASTGWTEVTVFKVQALQPYLNYSAPLRQGQHIVFLLRIAKRKLGKGIVLSKRDRAFLIPEPQLCWAPVKSLVNVFHSSSMDLNYSSKTADQVTFKITVPLFNTNKSLQVPFKTKLCYLIHSAQTANLQAYTQLQSNLTIERADPNAIQLSPPHPRVLQVGWVMQFLPAKNRSMDKATIIEVPGNYSGHTPCSDPANKVLRLIHSANSYKVIKPFQLTSPGNTLLVCYIKNGHISEVSTISLSPANPYSYTLAIKDPFYAGQYASVTIKGINLSKFDKIVVTPHECTLNSQKSSHTNVSIYAVTVRTSVNFVLQIHPREHTNTSMQFNICYHLHRDNSWSQVGHLNVHLNPIFSVTVNSPSVPRSGQALRMKLKALNGPFKLSHIRKVWAINKLKYSYCHPSNAAISSTDVIHFIYTNASLFSTELTNHGSFILCAGLSNSERVMRLYVHNSSFLHVQPSSPAYVVIMPMLPRVGVIVSAIFKVLNTYSSHRVKIIPAGRPCIKTVPLKLNTSTYYTPRVINKTYTQITFTNFNEPFSFTSAVNISICYSTTNASEFNWSRVATANSGRIITIHPALPSHWYLHSGTLTARRHFQLRFKQHHILNATTDVAWLRSAGTDCGTIHGCKDCIPLQLSQVSLSIITESALVYFPGSYQVCYAIGKSIEYPAIVGPVVHFKPSPVSCLITDAVQIGIVQQISFKAQPSAHVNKSRIFFVRWYESAKLVNRCNKTSAISEALILGGANGTRSLNYMVYLPIHFNTGKYQMCYTQGNPAPICNCEDENMNCVLQLQRSTPRYATTWPIVFSSQLISVELVMGDTRTALLAVVFIPVDRANTDQPCQNATLAEKVNVRIHKPSKPGLYRIECIFQDTRVVREYFMCALTNRTTQYSHVPMGTTAQFITTALKVYTHLRVTATGLLHERQAIRLNFRLPQRIKNARLADSDEVVFVPAKDRESAMRQVSVCNQDHIRNNSYKISHPIRTASGATLKKLFTAGNYTVCYRINTLAWGFVGSLVIKPPLVSACSLTNSITPSTLFSFRYVEIILKSTEIMKYANSNNRVFVVDVSKLCDITKDSASIQLFPIEIINSTVIKSTVFASGTGSYKICYAFDADFSLSSPICPTQLTSIPPIPAPSLIDTCTISNQAISLTIANTNSGGRVFITSHKYCLYPPYADTSSMYSKDVYVGRKKQDSTGSALNSIANGSHMHVLFSKAGLYRVCVVFDNKTVAEVPIVKQEVISRLINISTAPSYELPPNSQINTKFQVTFRSNSNTLYAVADSPLQLHAFNYGQAAIVSFKEPKTVGPYACYDWDKLRQLQWTEIIGNRTTAYIIATPTLQYNIMCYKPRDCSAQLLSPGMFKLNGPNPTVNSLKSEIYRGVL